MTAISQTDGPERTASIAAWLQALYPSVEEAPVLVGGAAVELYTRGAYRTSDLDFVGRVPDPVREALEEAGYRRRGRHWVHEEERIFLEFPAAVFDAPVRTAIVRFGDWSVRTLSPEDVLVDRLASWKFWKSVPDGVNAYLLWRDRGAAMDSSHLESRAAGESVRDVLESLREMAESIPSGAEGIEEAERWAQTIR